jgi:hypothetical protein
MTADAPSGAREAARFRAVLSIANSRSYSARDPKTPIIILPAAVLESTPSVTDTSETPRSVTYARHSRHPGQRWMPRWPRSQTACVLSSPKKRWCNGPGDGSTRLQGLRPGTQKLPTNLAHLSVNGARPLAIAQWVSAHGVIAREFVDTNLVGSGMLTQGSSAGACAGGIQRGASAVAAAADTPVNALFIISSFSGPPMAALLSPPTQCRIFTRKPTQRSASRQVRMNAGC